MINELAGILGLDPGPFTLRELTEMATARRRDAWDHTAARLAQVAEANRDPAKRRRPYCAEDFHPMLPQRKRRRRRRGDGIPVTAETLPLIATAVVGRPPPA